MTNRRMGCREEAKEEVRESIRVGFRKLKMRMVVENTMERVIKSVRARMWMRDRGC
jgi:hypothetical protein